MAASPQWKVFRATLNKRGQEKFEYVASFKHAEDAALFADSFMGEGSQVRHGHEKDWLMWTTGRENVSACEYVDTAADIMHNRFFAKRAGAIGMSVAEYTARDDRLEAGGKFYGPITYTDVAGIERTGAQ